MSTKTAASASSTKQPQRISFIASNGLEIKGTVEEVRNICSFLKEPIHVSKEKGKVVSISSMNTVHIMNTLIQKAKDYFGNLQISTKTPPSIPEFFELLIDWKETDEFDNLVGELKKRI